MEPKEQERAPRITGVDVSGESIEVDYSAGLMNVVLFFEPVTRLSLDTVEQIRLLSTKYQKLSANFWYVMEPRLSCMSRAQVAQRALDRLSLFERTLFDANNLVALYSGIRSVPAALVADSNSFLCLRQEGEISLAEIERTIQSRIALSGYRDELPVMQRPDRSSIPQRNGSIVRSLGYANADYVFGNMVVPESSQEFILPDFYLLNTIYPFGAWFVSRDFIEGKNGSTVYISCGKEENVSIFAGSDGGAKIRIYTSIESPRKLSLGKDVRTNGGLFEISIDEFRPYEVVSDTGDTDVLVSLQVMSGSAQFFSVEFLRGQTSTSGAQSFRQVRY